jgi:hypothetical protein
LLGTLQRPRKRRTPFPSGPDNFYIGDERLRSTNGIKLPSITPRWAASIKVKVDVTRDASARPYLEEPTETDDGKVPALEAGLDKEHARANLNRLDFSSGIGSSGRNRFMGRPLAKSPFVLLALALWILACPTSQSDDDELNLLNQQVQALFKQGKYQEAIPVAEKFVEVAKRARGSGAARDCRCPE